jgi:hypothetical protein
VHRHKREQFISNNMKKSGGIVIGVKKKKKPIVISHDTSKNNRPPSPVTVVNESSTNNANSASNNAGQSKSKHKLVIKPFQKPPSLPPDFYNTSLSTLQRASVAVLRREPLLLLLSSSTDTVEGGDKRRFLSREELYTSVQDLIVHGYGKELYSEVVMILNRAAGEVVSRLTGDGLVKKKCGGDDTMVCYDSETIVAMLGGTDENNQGSSSSETTARLEVLKQWHAVCRVAYAEEYLTFVRSIFLVLDRAFVFMSEDDLEMINSGRVASFVGENLKGKVMDRTSSFGGVNSRVWGLWEVGIACLRKHITLEPEALETSGRTFSVLTAMILVTTHALLSEYDDDPSSNQSKNQAVASSIVGDSRPLIRNCVQTCIDLGSISALLEELIIAASLRFRNENKIWGSALNESRKTAQQFLSHVEHRLKQSSLMTTYYLPSNTAASVALRQLSDRGEPLVGSSRCVDKRDGVIWKSVNSNTRRILPSIIEVELLSPHLVPTGILHHKHLYPILDDCDGDNSSTSWKTAEKTFENAKRLYGLCWRMTATVSSSSPSTALENLRIAFGKYGRLRGSEIISQGAQDTASGNSSKDIEKSIIPDLLLFKAHLQMLLTVAFRSDEAFAASVRSILEDVCNGSTLPGGGDGGRRIAELLAKHVDTRFKDAKAQASPAVLSTLSSSVDATSMSSDHNESFQNQIMAIFRHVHSKDVFEAFYKRDLAKRLLTGRSVSSDVERSFLSKLKAECGAGYTSKMEGMFKDMDLSRDIMTSYAAYSTGATSQNVATDNATEMDVQVLTTGYWPVYPQYPNIILPPELFAHQANFESYYKNKYQGRRIAWQYSLGNCIVKASFPKQPAGKELIINLCQTLVLLCFQYEDGPDGLGLNIDDIMKKTGIDDRAEVERVLQSLSLGRDGTRVLIKVDQDSPTEAPDVPSENSSPDKSKRKIRRNVGPHDRFLFNKSFTSNQRRIRITNITMKETAKERTETHEAVSKDRLYLIDAAVVRIMKARKTIDHRDLMGEVMTQLKFPSSSADIKKRIESLIEREYMERVEGNRSRYNYLA